MSRNRWVEEVSRLYEKKTTPAGFGVGDEVDVHVRIKEGERERIQLFHGVVISRRGTGTDAMFTVRRVVQGEGVERVFPLHSPFVEKVEVSRRGRVRRAKLYYLRELTGRAARIREKRGGLAEMEAGAAGAPAAPAGGGEAAPAGKAAEAKPPAEGKKPAEAKKK